jgi:hypothetical protein
MTDDQELTAPYGPTALVGLGWYATLIAAWLTSQYQVNDPSSCDSPEGRVGWCFTAAEGAVLWLGLMSPAVLIPVGVMLLAARWIRRSTTSAPLAGTLAAAASAVVTGCLGGVFLVLR